MSIDFALILRIITYVLIAFVATNLAKHIASKNFSWWSSFWSPIGLIPSRLERLETPAYDVITEIEGIRRVPGESAIPLECSRGYQERLRRDRNNYICLLKHQRKKFRSTWTFFRVSRSDREVLNNDLKDSQRMEALAHSMRDALVVWIRRGVAKVVDAREGE